MSKYPCNTFVCGSPSLSTASPAASFPENGADERIISSSSPDVPLPGKHEDEHTPSPPAPTVSPQARQDEHAPSPDDSLRAIAGDDGTVGYKSLHDML